MALLYTILYLRSSLASILKKLSPLLFLLLLNLFFSSYQLITLNLALRFILYLTLISGVNWSKHRDLVLSSLTFTLLFQLALAVVQIYQGSSVQGIFYWLGERNITLSSPAVAKTAFFGETSLRAYGTFSHPNTLAGWSLATIIIFSLLNRAKHLALLPLAASLLIILSGSRAALLALLILILVRAFAHKSRAILIGSLSIALIVLAFLSPALIRDPLSLSERIDLFRRSLTFIKAFPLFGTGMGASLSLYDDFFPRSRLLQPDHNSATLLLSYFGISLLPIIAHFKRQLSDLFSSDLLPILFLLMVDHYFLTSVQGLWIILLLLKLIYEKNSSRA